MAPFASSQFLIILKRQHGVGEIILPGFSAHWLEKDLTVQGEVEHGKQTYY
jgi:hypothetical protein